AVVRRKYHNLNGIEKFYDGEAKLLRMPSGRFACITTQHEFTPNEGWKKDCYEKFILNNQKVFVFDPVSKKVLVQSRPIPKEQRYLELVYWPAMVADVMPFCFWLNPKSDLTKRIEFRVTQIDSNYTYVEIKPKAGRLFPEFQVGRLVIMNADASVVKKGER